MITIDKERKALELLEYYGGAHNYGSIAELCGLSRSTVARLHRNMKLLFGISDSTLKEVGDLLRDNFTIKSISSKTGLETEQVLSIRRKLFFCSNGKRSTCKITPCPTCGNLIFPKTEIESEPKRYNAPLRMIRSDLEDIWNIVGDIAQLDDLHIVCNPAFHFIAQRAKKVLKASNDQS